MLQEHLQFNLPFFHSIVIPYSLYTNDDDNSGNRPPTLNKTFKFFSGIHLEKHGN
jgi:hypothetical protein